MIELSLQDIYEKVGLYLLKQSRPTVPSSYWSWDVVNALVFKDRINPDWYSLSHPADLIQDDRFLYEAFGITETLNEGTRDKLGYVLEKFASIGSDLTMSEVLDQLRDMAVGSDAFRFEPLYEYYSTYLVKGENDES